MSPRDHEDIALEDFALSEAELRARVSDLEADKIILREMLQVALTQLTESRSSERGSRAPSG
jgi:DNA-binding Lrp family transcriptional regulator